MPRNAPRIAYNAFLRTRTLNYPKADFEPLKIEMRLADEIIEHNPTLYEYIKKSLPELKPEFMPHDELKKFSAGMKFAIRTGEFSPYPNVILRAGVVF